MISKLIAILLIAFTTYILYKLIYKPYKAIQEYKQRYGDKVFCFFYPILGIFKNILQSGALVEENYFFLPIRQKVIPKTVVTNFNGNILLKVIDPELIKEICSTKNDLYVKHFDDILMNDKLLKYGVLILSGEEWKCQRKLLAPLFEYQNLKDRIPTINQEANQLVEELINEKSEYSIIQKIKNSTSNIVCSAFFGEKFKQKVINGKPLGLELEEILTELGIHSFKSICHRLRSAFFKNNFDKTPKFLYTRKEKKMIKRTQNFLDSINTTIKDRLDNKEQDTCQNDFLQTCLKGYQEGIIDFKNISQLFFTLFFAGMDTTAQVTTLMLYYLSVNPKDQEVLRQEANKLFPNGTENIQLSDLQQMTETQKFMMEVLRIKTPIQGIIMKKALKDHYIGEFYVKKDTMLDLHIYSTNHNPEYHENPQEFNMNREDANKKHPYAFVPFSAGPRNCIGQHMGIIEIKIFIAKILQKYQVIRDESVPFEMNFQFLYTPVNSNLVKFKKI